VRAAGGDIVAVSPDPPDQNEQLRAKLGVSFRILSDVGMAVTDMYGVRHLGAAGPRDLPYPTTFIVDAGGLVVQRFDNETYRVRPDPRLVVEALLAAARHS